MGRAVVMMALAACLAVSVGCASGSIPGQEIEGSVLAAVSYSPDEMVLIDPGSLTEIDRIRLRSMGTDPLALPDARVFVTAQCGGLGGDADDALALIDLDRGGVVRYVDLPDANPGFVESAGGSKALVSHGVWSPQGIPVTLVDLVSGEVVHRGLVANAYGALVVAAGYLWTVGPEGPEIGSQVPTIRRTSLDLQVSQVFPVDGELPLIVPDGESTGTILTVRSGGHSATVNRVSAMDLKVTASVELADIRDGIAQVVEADDLLVLSDSSGVEMSRAGGPLIVLDRATLRELRRIDMGGSVASIATIGDSVFAVTWDTGELIEVDPAAGRVLRRTRLQGFDGKMSQLAAMDSADAPDRPRR